MVELEQMREQHLLQDRVVLMGSVSPSDVHSVSRYAVPIHNLHHTDMILLHLRYSIEDKSTFRRL